MGPVQVYVAPVIVEAIKVRVSPAHIGELLVATGADGVGFTATLIAPAAEVHPFKVAVTKYVPLLIVCAFRITGFCCEDVKPEGPVQL